MIYLFLLFVSCLGFKPAGSFCMILFCIISYSLDHFALCTFFLYFGINSVCDRHSGDIMILYIWDDVVTL